MSICEDSDRNLWIGSYRDGLAKLNPQTGHCEYIYLPDKDHKPAQSIYSIIEDKHRQLGRCYGSWTLPYQSGN